MFIKLVFFLIDWSFLWGGGEEVGPFQSELIRAFFLIASSNLHRLFPEKKLKSFFPKWSEKKAPGQVDKTKQSPLGGGSGHFFAVCHKKKTFMK